MRKLYSVFALCAFLFLSVSSYATDYTYGDNNNTLSAILPLTTSSSTYTSISQQLFLASDLTGIEAEAGDITALTFYYGGKSNNTAVRAVTRNIEIYISAVSPSFTEFEINSSNHRFKFVDPGTKVYDGAFATEAITVGQVKTKKITLSNSFAWDGTKNIVITMFDKTNSKFYSTTDYSDVNLRFALIQVEPARFVHIHQLSESSDEFSTYKSSLANKEGETYSTPSTDDGQRTSHHWVNRITFSITPSVAPVVPSVPEDLAASPASTSASISWTAVDGATSYDLYHSTSAEGVYTKFASPSTNSYEWTGLTANTTYFVKVAAVNDAGSSALSDPISFTTLTPHIHDGITFEPWSNPAALPTSGNYYLANEVMLDPYDPTTITLTGNLNLCLNGHVANVFGSKIVVPDGKTLAIFDNVGGGRLTGFVASEVGAFDIYAKALIVVRSGGELDLHQGIIENTYIPDEDGQSYAIYSNGTIHLSGDVLINSNSADIYLYASNYIILDGALSNAEKHSVWKNGGTFTYGWSTYMSGENPRDYFESANIARAVCLNEGEAALRTLLHLSESSNNSSIKDNRDILLDISLTRSLTSSQYNTFCLPINLTNEQLEEHFGVGYDLQEFDHSDFDGETLELIFVKRTALTEGAPYLIKPAFDVVNPYFEGVTIYSGEPGSDEWDDNIAIYSTFAPTELEGGNKSLLFLGAGNELFYPQATANIKAFRAYFELKGAAKQSAPKARIVKKEDQTQAIDLVENPNAAHKRIIDGQLVIEKNGMRFNAQGQMVK